VLNLVLSFAAGRAVLTLILGIVLTVLGILYLTGPAFVITETEVQRKNPLGMTLKRFPITSLADLRIDGRGLVHVPTGTKIAAVRGYADSKDGDRLRAMLAAHGAPPPADAPAA